MPILHTLMSCIALFNHFVCNILIIAELIHREVVSTPSVHGEGGEERKKERKKGKKRAKKKKEREKEGGGGGGTDHPF